MYLETTINCAETYCKDKNECSSKSNELLFLGPAFTSTEINKLTDRLVRKVNFLSTKYNNRLRREVTNQ